MTDLGPERRGGARRPIVGVMGSGTREHRDKAEPLGHWLASQGVHLLTGGGRGVMTAVSRAFAGHSGRRGLVIGVIPDASAGHAPGRYPNAWVDLPIFTHLPLTGREGLDPLSRNHINVLSSDVIVALPGSAGTASEVQLAIRYGRPVVAYLDDRSEIPDLPPEVPVVSELEEVQAFVTKALQSLDRIS